MTNCKKVCLIKPTTEKKFVRKVLIVKGYSIDVRSCSDGATIICLHTNKRTIFFTVYKDYIHKQIYLSNPIHMKKSKIIRW